MESKNKKRTIVFLAKSIDGGTGTFYFSLLRNKKVVFDNNKVVPLVLERPTFRKIPTKLNIRYFVANNYYPQKFTFSITTAKKLLDEFLWFRENLERINPDVIVTVDTHCALLASHYKTIFHKKIPTIVTIHNNVIDTLSIKASSSLENILLKAMQQCFKSANKVVCVSKDLSNNLKEKFNLPILPTTIYYGITPPRINNIPRTNREKIIVSIGRFEEQKDFPTLITAFAAVIKDYPHPLKLWLVGNGSLQGEYQKLVAKLKMKRAIQFFDWQKDPYILLQQADIFVLSSKREGFPFVLLEALACHKPTIATDCPFGPREILGQGRYGKLVPPKDTASLKNTVLALLTNRKEFHHMAAQAQKRSLFFTEEKMIHNYKNIISSFLQ